MTIELEFCGHIIRNSTLQLVPVKLNIIYNWPHPQNMYKIHQFLRLILYYYYFIKHFAQIPIPLQDLLYKDNEALHTKKKQSITQTAGAKVAFHTLKGVLLSASVMIQPDLDKPFYIKIDTSEWALGCVLIQEGDNNLFHPLTFNRQHLKGMELNYLT